jgi:hypothetical protein
MTHVFWAALIAGAVALGTAACSRQQGALASSATTPAAPAAVDAPAGAPDVPEVSGRFVVVHSPQVERDTVLLDTATGRTWTESQITDVKGDPLVWVPMPQMNGAADWSALVAQHGSKGKQAAAEYWTDVASSAPASPETPTTEAPPQQ